MPVSDQDEDEPAHDDVGTTACCARQGVDEAQDGAVQHRRLVDDENVSPDEAVLNPGLREHVADDVVGLEPDLVWRDPRPRVQCPPAGVVGRDCACDRRDRDRAEQRHLLELPHEKRLARARRARDEHVLRGRGTNR